MHKNKERHCGDYDGAWEEYMIYGGLPQVAQFSVERQKAEYLKNIYTNVYIKDVVERNRIQNVDEIGTLVDILASAKCGCRYCGCICKE